MIIKRLPAIVICNVIGIVVPVEYHFLLTLEIAFQRFDDFESDGNNKFVILESNKRYSLLPQLLLL